jgi:hypothetical protein
VASRDELIAAQRDLLRRRKQAYGRTFDGPGAADVLADLAAFCRARTSTFDADPRVHAALEGRREVWLRIMEYTQLSEDDLWKLKGG